MTTAEEIVSNCTALTIEHQVSSLKAIANKILIKLTTLYTHFVAIDCVTLYSNLYGEAL